MTPTPCPACSAPILLAPSLSGVELQLQPADPRRDSKAAAVFCIRAGKAQITTPEPGEPRCVAHKPNCRKAAA